MPSTINGIGTWYYGKKNLQTSPGVCELCQQAVELETYETRLWFVVIFVPVIPLGTKQILDSCPRCRRHRVLPLAEWEKVRDESIQQSAEQLEMNREDPEAGLQMLSTLAAFRKRDEATKLSRLLLERHPEHAEVQFAVGGWLEFVGEHENAGACFKKSYELEPENRNYRRASGLTLAIEGQLEQAHEQLEIFEPPSRHYDPVALIHLARQAHEHEDHTRAIEVFAKVLKATPQLAREKHIRKLVRASEKSIGATESILPRQNPFRSKLFWAVLIVLLAVLGFCVAGTVIVWN